MTEQRKYDTGEIVQFDGKQWRVTDFYFDLRNIDSLDGAVRKRVATYQLDKENAPKETPLPFDEVQSW